MADNIALTMASISMALVAILIGVSFGSARAESPDDAITTLSDGSSQADLTYTAAGSRTTSFTVPADWTVASATLELNATSIGITETDQKNEATKYEGTWGVRAQQFQPSERKLTSVELFLAHTSSKPGDFTVEIREDDGQGYPSDKILASVTKPVSPGGYRWELFSFPEVEVGPGRSYWIVNYVGSLNAAKYPAVPSIGDYGYYIGMSLNDEYPNGDSADFLTSPNGAHWEKYASRKNWDLMFRTDADRQHFPADVSVSLGDQSNLVWQHPGELTDSSAVIDFASQLAVYMGLHQNEPEGTAITVPLTVISGSPGTVTISSIDIVRKVEPAITSTAEFTPTVTPLPTNTIAVTPTVTSSVTSPLTPSATDRDASPVTPQATITSTQISASAQPQAPAPDALPPSAPAEASPARPSESKFVPPSEIALKSLGYSDITIQGVAASTDIYFPGAGGFQLTDGNYLKIYFSHSGVLLADRSVMSVRVNDVPMADVRLTSDNVQRTELTIPIPQALLLDTVNHVRLLFYMRIMDGVCTDELNNPALNSTVYSDSAIHYQYAAPVSKKSLPDPNLSSYPLPFIHPGDPWPDEVYFVLPENPSIVELTAAASISAKLGSLAAGKPVTATLALPSQLDPETRAGHSFIFVGKAGSLDLPPELRAAASLDVRQGGPEPAAISLDGQPVASDNGILKEVVSPWNAHEMILLVTGATDLAMKKASTMLTGKTYISSLSGSQSIVTEDPRPPSSLAEPGPDEAREATFAQMGVSEIAVNGIGDLPSASVSFDAPPPNPKDIAYTDLVFSHSPLIGTDGSSLRIELNGTAVGSIALDDNNSELTTAHVVLPYVALKPGRNTLTFRFTIRTVGTQECGPVDPSRGWVVIDPTSLIHLPPAGPKPTLNLALFSYPFLRSGPLLESAFLDSSILVLPSDQASWRDALQLAVGLGRFATTDVVTLPTMLDRDVTEQMKQKSNLILYGVWGTNKLIEEANSLLPLLFVQETGKTITKETESVVGVQDEVPIGVVEQVSSPWNKDLATIVVSGTAPDTLPWATATLARGGIRGNLATITQEDKVTSFDIPFDEASIPSRRSLLTVPLVGTTSVGLLVLGALAMILIEPRLKSGKDKNGETGEQ